MAYPEAVQARLLRGLPLLSFDHLPVEAMRFAKLASALARVLSDYDPGLVERTVPRSPAEWLNLARQRFEKGQVNVKQQEAQDEVTLAQASVGLALRPYLEWAAEQVLPHVDLERWKRSYCPTCGGVPDFATLGAEVSAQYLLCSRCNSQ